jgi:AcrR family transcriptional regulator
MGVHPSDPTRARILRAATELFAERGFRRTGVRAICAKARTNVAAVNYHFRSKERLYLEVFRIHFDGVHQPLLALPTGPRRGVVAPGADELVDYMLRTRLSERPPEVWVRG